MGLDRGGGTKGPASCHCAIELIPSDMHATESVDVYRRMIVWNSGCRVNVIEKIIRDPKIIFHSRTIQDDCIGIRKIGEPTAEIVILEPT